MNDVPSVSISVTGIVQANDDEQYTKCIKVRTTGATGLGIEVDGVVMNLDSAIELFLTSNSLDDVFIVGAATTSSGAESFEIAIR